MDANKVNLTIEVANAVMAYRAFMDAGAGAYSYEGVLHQVDRQMVPMNRIDLVP